MHEGQPTKAAGLPHEGDPRGEAKDNETRKGSEAFILHIY